MKKIKKQFLFLLCSIFVVGCADDIEIIPNNSTSSLSVEKARTWYETNFMANQGSTIFKAKTTDSTALSLKPLLNWDLAQLDNDSLWSVVELPWEYENGKQTIANSQVTEYCTTNNADIVQVIRLVILENRKTGDVYGFKMVVIPDLDYMLAHENELQANFYLHRDPALSGMILFYSTSDKFINGWAYKNGMIVGKVKQGNSKSKSEAQRTSSTFEIHYIEMCNYTKVDWKGMVGGNKDCSVLYYFTYGSSDSGSDLTGSFDTNSGTLGGSSESSTNQSGCPGTAYKDNCGFCVGGDTGKSPCIEEENNTSDPCAEINKLKIDAALIQRLKDYINKTKNDATEDGYMKRSDGFFLPPTIREFDKTTFRHDITDKFSEKVHSHLDIAMGTCVFSAADLRNIYSLFINGNMEDPATFKYICVSSLGIGCLQITDQTAFTNFGSKNSLIMLKDIYRNTTLLGTDINDYIRQFLDILKSTNSGLSYSVGEFDMESSNPEINWSNKQLNNTGNVTTINCN